MFDVEGHHPVLLSGSWDTTVSVWDLETMEYKRTLEGHTGQVSDLKIFSIGGNDAAVASCSTDTTVRVLFDFLGSIPKTDVIRHLFRHDLQGTAAHLQLTSTVWPRIKEAMKYVGLEMFFSIHYELFADALEYNRSDFLLEFLPQCRAGLVKCNNLTKKDEDKDGDGEDGDRFTYRCMDRNLLMRAIQVGNRVAIGIIVSCWCKFLCQLPTSEADPMYEVVEDEYFLIDVMEALADHSPREYEKLICSIRLMPVKGNRIPLGSNFLVRNSRTRNMELRDDLDSFSAGDYYYFLPVPYYASAQQLKVFDKVCNRLGSVAIFDSEAGNAVLTYSWLAYGMTGHLESMGVYLFFIVVSSVDIFLFEYVKDDLEGVYYAIAATELLLDAFYLKAEMDQFFDDSSRYFLHVWNYLDLLVIFGNIVCVLLRCIFWTDIVAYKFAASLFSIAMWFNMLHYLRAFESTGPLVSMILRISSDIKYLMVVLMLVLVGFSQAFWVVATRHTTSPFSTFDSSMLALFTFMVGDFTPFDLPGTSSSGSLDRYLQLLSTIYMLIVAILLLNLLIALMGDSFGTVKTDALAHWALYVTSHT
mmetsp:Transcript_26208/g.56680  ORF Transcript_26208/g.56680 Transcript_26208/m.56680 type:complete len:586 (-) Transcript_26208:813-2570(-)